MLAIPTAESMLDDLARLAAQAIAPPASCGITMRRGAAPMTVASSDALAMGVDEIQYGQDAGPCLQALRTGEAVGVPDMSVEHRWGAFSAHAMTYGVQSSLSLPLVVDGDRLGALNLYGTTKGAFPPRMQELATLFAGQAAAALTVLIRQARQTQLSDQLREALAGRTTIDQALGIIMGQQRCTAEQAFAILRTASQHRNVKLRDIAAKIVLQTTGTAPTPPPPFSNPVA
jgi:GAF domain-containing protein